MIGDVQYAMRTAGVALDCAVQLSGAGSDGCMLLLALVLPVPVPNSVGRPCLVWCFTGPGPCCVLLVSIELPASVLAWFS
jgi:hypothetical protein